MSERRHNRLRNVGLATSLVALLILGFVTPANAAETIDDARPDRVVLTPTQHPETSQAFTWRTGADVIDGNVTIRRAGSSDPWREVAAHHNDALDGEKGFEVRTHSATVEGLETGTAYEYFVGNGDAQSETWTFTTAGQPGDPFTFLYFGDAQNQLGDKWRPTVTAAYDRYPDAIGTVNAGDLINRSNSSEWTQWFAGMDGYSQTGNVIAAPGNHEYSDDSFMRHWKSNFEYPANGPTAAAEATGEDATDAQKQEAAYRAHMADVLTETVYFTDYQGVRFISLNASRSQARTLFTPPDLPNCLIGCPDPTALWLDMQGSWLDEILKNNPNQWAVATFHQPVFSTATGRDEADLRMAWLPVFQNNDIDLVLMGHDHTYARGYVNADATDTPGITTGPVYAVAVAGPKYYDMQPEDNNVWTQNGATQVARAGHTSTFQGITVDGGTLRYESIVSKKWDGEEASSTDVPVGGVLDSFTITKYENGTKYVTEDGVEIPEPGTIDPVDPVDPGEEVEETPAEQPADVPVEHHALGNLTSPTVRGHVAFDNASGILYVADDSADGVGRVEAIDPETDTVLRTFDVGSPVTAMSFTPVEGGMLLIASEAGENGETGQANAYSVNSAYFGEGHLSDNIPLPAPITGMTLDGGSLLLYFSLSIGVVAILDVDAGKITGQVPFGPELRGLKVDDATGNVYVALDQGETGALHIYSKGLGADPIRTFDLVGGASNIDLDTADGLAYVSHVGNASGMSAVDVISSEVHHESTELTGNDVRALTTHPSQKRIYTSTGTGVNVLARAQAPTVTLSPEPVTVDAGVSTELSVDGYAVPAPRVQWEVREGDAWAPVEGASGWVVTVTPEQTTQYRAVLSNEVRGETYTTASATATVAVRSEAPVDPVDPVDPAQPGDPAPTDPSTPDDASSDDGAVVPVTSGAGRSLASTGEADLGMIATGALVLMVLGLLTVVLRRRAGSIAGQVRTAESAEAGIASD